MTYTCATMEVSKATFLEIKAKLEEAGYDHAILDDDTDNMLDMTHIALTMGTAATNVEPVMDLCEHAFRKGIQAGRVDPLDADDAWSHYSPPEDVLSRLHSGEGV